MAPKMTAGDLYAAGVMIDPADPTQAVPIDRQAVPDDSWDLDRLGRYATDGLAEALGLARRSTVQTFRAGRALWFARRKLKADGGWVEWLKRHRIPRTNAWEAIQLYEKAKTEKAVADLSLCEAKEAFGIARYKPRAAGGCEAAPAPAGPAASTCCPDEGLEEHVVGHRAEVADVNVQGAGPPSEPPSPEGPGDGGTAPPSAPPEDADMNATEVFAVVVRIVHLLEEVSGGGLAGVARQSGERDVFLGYVGRGIELFRRMQKEVAA